MTAQRHKQKFCLHVFWTTSALYIFLCPQIFHWHIFFLGYAYAYFFCDWQMTGRSFWTFLLQSVSYKHKSMREERMSIEFYRSNSCLCFHHGKVSTLSDFPCKIPLKSSSILGGYWNRLVKLCSYMSSAGQLDLTRGDCLR